MRSIVFDTGPIISIATNNLLWVLEELKKRYDGEFYITSAVKKEVMDKPLRSKMFKLEALQIMFYISKGVIKILEEVMILRTRSDINERYPDLTIQGKKITFQMAECVLNLKFHREDCLDSKANF